ncbi:caspase family protein [Actinoplanes sp. NBC_00393]|uniref:caspase family protein n=1 Tax=Actinoplanes sp. NBC_00393 TaxID=2975953 RepID=UPI002E1C6059
MLKAAAQDAEDVLFVYYTGHGCLEYDRNVLHLAGPETDPEMPEFGGISIDTLRGVLRKSPAARKVLVLDCCFSGRATASLSSQSDIVRAQIDIAGTLTLAASPGTQVSVVLPGERNTAFTGRLLQLLRDGVPGGPPHLDVDTLYATLHRRMRDAGLHEPQRLSAGHIDRLVLAPNRAWRPAPAQAREPVPAQVREPAPCPRRHRPASLCPCMCRPRPGRSRNRRPHLRSRGLKARWPGSSGPSRTSTSARSVTSTTVRPR